MNNRVDGIYESITRKDIKKLFFIGGLIGIIIFIFCYGWRVLDVTNDGWLLSGNDISQHYIGWKFYRASDWHFPIGQIDGILYPETSCIIFSDSIPLFAIFFKALSPILPDTFQYFGIWGGMSYFLAGGLTAVILRKSTEKAYLCWIGSAILSFSPYVFQRMYAHTALAGHWIILAALGIWMYKPYFSGFCKKLAAWGSLLIIASLVHIYFIPMVMIFMFGFCLQDVLENKGWKEDLIFAPIAVAADLVVLYIVGAFGKSGEFSDDGLGLYSANLNSLFNSNGRSRFLKSLAMRPGQDEGFGYLGLGILLLLGCAAGVWIVRMIWMAKKEKVANENFLKKYAFGISICVTVGIAMVLAWSPTVTIGQRILFAIPYPSPIIKILSTFRASGRFIWCVGYVIMFFCMMTVCRYVKQSIAGICMIVALAAQGADMSEMIAAAGAHGISESQFQLIQSEMWNELAEGKEHFVILPYSTINGKFGSAASYETGNFAVDHGMTINYFPLARTDLEAIALNDAEYVSALKDGEDCSKFLYVLDTKEKGQELGLDVYEIDGCYVGTAK